MRTILFILLLFTMACSKSDDYEVRRLTLKHTQAITSHGSLFEYRYQPGDEEWTLLDTPGLGMQLVELNTLKVELFPDENNEVYVGLDINNRPIFLGNIVFIGTWQVSRTDTSTQFYRRQGDDDYSEEYYITFEL